MSKASQDLEKAIATTAKIGSHLPQNIPEWMQKMGISPADIIIESTKIGNKSSNNKTDVLIRFNKSKPLKISVKLGNAGYFGNWYGHERFIKEFGRNIFNKLTLKTSLWANEWANKSNASLFVGVSISFGERTGNTFIPFLDIFDNIEDMKKIICGVGEEDNAANCLYVSNEKPKSIEDLVEKLSPLDLETVKQLSEKITVIFRPINPFTEASNRGKNVYTKFQPHQPLSEITDVTNIKDLMKLGKFTEVFPNRLNHNHILDTLQADYKIRIPLRPNPTRQWQFYSESKT
ncbi:hypothetical protein H6F42_06965 [Pseudanabaena sp. FACHB-1998]|uniref:hypothetical protein n=1 Tax=Pseudanabaena sp. FACHB-1998 TaxID=2692858 RepID=UPI001680BD94|nr:hypothetical protein [Pseudanabaena sp. FACHB-1998]MBD2176655.1 hypothetical protein [Pseudanabaena sp. FACHB-1998]